MSARSVIAWIDNPRHEQFVRLPFPLATGELAHLTLPTDLLPEEADRMAAAIQAWVRDREGDERG